MQRRTHIVGGSSPELVRVPLLVTRENVKDLSRGLLMGLPATKANLTLVESPLLDGNGGTKSEAPAPVADAFRFVCCGREWLRENNESCPFCFRRGKPFETVDPELAKWQELARDPKNVAVEQGGEVSIAHVGPEPTDYRDWLTKARSKMLGCGGKGWVLVDLFGEGAITHNLSDIRSVPPQYAHLFRITHMRVERMDDRQESAHWARFDPFGQGDAKRVA